MTKNITNIRKEYLKTTLSRADIELNPHYQFKKWLDEAVTAGISEPNAMSLSTVDNNGRPTARIVLLRGYGPDGFRFYTNYLSRKGLDLEKNPQCALLFYWPEIERQVRIEAQAVKLPPSESDAYFEARPFENKLASWASQQSQIVAARSVIERSFNEFREMFGNRVPRPPHWGGYLASPFAFEFWQGRENRLHDRFRYEIDSVKKWSCYRLAP
jgi:pyridoxamine 5'-phosphate oxidase